MGHLPGHGPALFAFDRAEHGRQHRCRSRAGQHVTDVSADRSIQTVTVDQGQDPTERGLAGHQIPASPPVPAGPDPSQNILAGTRGPLPDRRQRVVTHNQRRARRQHQNHHQRMLTTPRITRIRHLFQPPGQRRHHHLRIGGKFGFPQRQIRKAVNSRVDRGG